jgi:hypothetical protein
MIAWYTGSLNDIRRTSNDPTVALGALVAGVYVSYTSTYLNGLVAASLVIVANTLVNYGTLSNNQENFNTEGLWNPASLEQQQEFRDRGGAEECSDPNAKLEMSKEEKVVCNLMGENVQEQEQITADDIRQVVKKNAEPIEVVASNNEPDSYKRMNISPVFDLSLED